MKSIVNPPAYVEQVQVEQIRQQATTEQTLLTRAPNYLHRDGRIYASRPNEPYCAVTVSPFNPRFETQIEPQVLPVVQALLDKNYLPVSSCQGHNGSALFVRLAFGSQASAERFMQNFQDIEYVTAVFLTTSANVMQYQAGTQIKYRRLETEELNAVSREQDDINIMFGRSYTKVCYVDLRLYQLPDGLLNFWRRWLIERDRQQNFDLRLATLIGIIKNLESYEL